ncbi:hypothetical protein F4821DRAFT_262855 [Hypoxylon rubiginosum]|uniref:Uncharacterized protein n=1 Tax=Hypoxylon rubiginosum TaxID=110542 RepID=A0ACC0CSQ8_9PEZI|nr:hypothetical protein F4821DRAFT_262855 [Hypoxylon rubiginosum]
MSFRRFAVAAVLAFATVASAANTQEVAPQDPISGTDTVHGCYKSLGTMTKAQTDEFNTQGSCTKFCRNLGKVAAASNAKICYCGDVYPNKADLVNDDQCTEPCPGYDSQACGGLDTYTVYNTGVRVTVGEAPEAGSSSSTTSTASATKTSSVSDAPASTSDTIETITASSEPDSNSSSGPNVAGIAAGVVVGVVCVSGIIGGIFFWLRRKRNAEIEEEHRRNAAVNAFISGGGKPPSSSGGLSMSDSRLDPVMNRRMSDGSIADNQDYSRRILRVRNADVQPDDSIV